MGEYNLVLDVAVNPFSHPISESLQAYVVSEELLNYSICILQRIFNSCMQRLTVLDEVDYFCPFVSHLMEDRFFCVRLEFIDELLYRNQSSYCNLISCLERVILEADCKFKNSWVDIEIFTTCKVDVLF